MSRSFDEIDLRSSWGSSRPTVVIDLLGIQASLAWGMDALALGGRLVVLTTFRDVDLPMSPRDIVLRELTILGSRYASKAELTECAELVVVWTHPSGRVAGGAAEGVEEVHRALRDGTLIGRGALDWNL